MKTNWLKEIGEWVVCFVIAYAIYLVISSIFGTIAGIKQSSMYPTAKEGDRVLISRRVLYSKTLSRGDVVIIEEPIGSATKEDPIAKYEKKTGLSYFVYNIMGLGKRSYIKRIIGLEKEHLYISEDGDVYINDEKLEESYLVDGLKTPRTGEVYDVVIPEGYIFVMGDNREGSRDSREIGLIPVEKVEGKVVTRIWPLTKIGKL